MTYPDRELDALGDRTRRCIFERLAARPRAVGELAAELPVSRPAVSQHLRVLRRAGLVTDRAAGSRRVYQVDPAGVLALRAHIDALWQQALASFEPVAEPVAARDA
jgi:DNA-binding transcriptional ArsR family regulator